VLYRLVGHLCSSSGAAFVVLFLRHSRLTKLNLTGDLMPINRLLVGREARSTGKCEKVPESQPGLFCFLAELETYTFNRLPNTSMSRL
jgi:hypothetical protein